MPLSLSQAKKIPRATLLRMINKAKKFLQKDDSWIKACKDHDEDPSIIDTMPVMFGNLDVSAKTTKGVITLNFKLLTEEDIAATISQYLIHECLHIIQQTEGTKPTKSSDNENYLHNEHEQEAFSTQISFIADHLGKDEAKDYTENLLDYHEVDNKKEKKELKDKLLSKASQDHYTPDQKAIDNFLNIFDTPNETSQEEFDEFGAWSKYSYKLVPISDIEDRPIWSEEKYDNILEKMKKNTHLDPVKLGEHHQGGKWTIIDGIHRINASKEMGYTYVPAFITEWIKTPPFENKK